MMDNLIRRACYGVLVVIGAIVTLVSITRLVVGS